jgi:hypothetical protein
MFRFQISLSTGSRRLGYHIDYDGDKWATAIVDSTANQFLGSAISASILFGIAFRKPGTCSAL